MIFKERNAFALEHMCLVAPESTIQLLREEAIICEEAKRHIPVVNDDEGLEVVEYWSLV